MKLNISIFSISAVLFLVIIYCALGFGAVDIGHTYNYGCAGRSQFLGCKQ